MRSVKNRIGRLEAGLGGKPSVVQVIIVPSEVPQEEWDSYVMERADGRPLLVFPEGMTLEECIKKQGVVDLRAEKGG
jgi:hypothetical protein